MRVCITGSSAFGDKKRLFAILDKNIDKIDQIVVGSCKDLDRISYEWVSLRGKVLVKFFSKIDEETGMLTKGGHLKARREMIQYSDMVLLLDNGQSDGAKLSLEIAGQLNKKIKIIEF